jgi:thioredoxin reductase
MESKLIWIAAVVVALFVFVPYLFKFRSSQVTAQKRRDEARELGIESPRSQYPQINRTYCIGCGACVDACPEGDVLAVVWGTAEVINGDRCVGHGYCETACPVSALKVGLGDVTGRPDIPVLTEHNETSVPGIFIAGELSGISLIRHAIVQGQRVAEEIGRRRGARPAPTPFDLIIAGAGPAGLSAALKAKELGMRAVVLDQYGIGGSILHYPRQKLVMTQPAEIPLYGPLTRDEYSKEELLELWQTLVRDHQLDVRPEHNVESIAVHDDGYRVLCTDKSPLAAPYLVLALGRRGSPRRLGVPGQDLPKVLYQLIDAQSYRGQHMLVVGGGDSAVEAACGLARQPGNTVTLSYRKPKLFRIKKKNEDAVTALIDGGKVNALFNSEVVEVRPNSVVLKQPDGTVEMPNDVVIVQIGGVPPFEMLKRMGIAFGGDSIGYKELERRANARV